MKQISMYSKIGDLKPIPLQIYDISLTYIYGLKNIQVPFVPNSNSSFVPNYKLSFVSKYLTFISITEEMEN